MSAEDGSLSLAARYILCMCSWAILWLELTYMRTWGLMTGEDIYLKRVY